MNTDNQIAAFVEISNVLDDYYNRMIQFENCRKCLCSTCLARQYPMLLQHAPSDKLLGGLTARLAGHGIDRLVELRGDDEVRFGSRHALVFQQYDSVALRDHGLVEKVFASAKSEHTKQLEVESRTYYAWLQKQRQ